MNVLEDTTATILSMLTIVAIVGSMTKITSNLMSLLRLGLPLQRLPRWTVMP